MPVLLTALLAASPMRAADPDPAQKSQALLRKAALTLLTEGNARFVAGTLKHPNCDAAQRSATALEGQEPIVTMLACSDSRVPVELIFDRGVGEIFTVRVAGNVADTDEIATVEYGVGHLGTPLLVVLGHTRCGAVTAVVKGAELHGLLPKLVDNIQPAVEQARKEGGEEKTVVANAIKANVWQSVADILRRSDIVRKAVADRNLSVVGALYDLETGVVEWLGEHPAQKTLLEPPKTDAVAAAPAHAPIPAPAPNPVPTQPPVAAIQGPVVQPPVQPEPVGAKQGAPAAHAH